ncbi:MAG: response regulator transcription factor [Candidatus Bipolaricaulia bacterium]
MAKKILLVDDDPDILRLLRAFLSSRGYETLTAGDGPKALEAFAKERPDLVLLDVMLPGMDGWEVLRRIREGSSTPVLMLTARDSPIDTIQGFTLGADDYIRKPFDLMEVALRIEAVLRRAGAAPREALIEAGPLTIDDKSKTVQVRGEVVHLSPKEYELLRLLASQRGKVFSDREIIDHLWPGSSFARPGDVQKYIYLLRKRIERDPQNPELILTVRGFGYKLAD